MNRPRSRRVLTGVIALGLITSACAGAAGVAPTTMPVPPTSTVGGTPTSTTTSLPTSVYGGTVVLGLADQDSPRTFNPLLDGPDTTVLDLLAPALFARGYSVDPSTRRRIPNVLAGIPSLTDGSLIDNGDGTQDVTVEVVDGAQWADGAPITASDLEFTYQIVSDPLFPIRPDAVEAYAAVVPGSLRVDGRSLTFRMRAGTDPTDLFGIIVPRHQVEASDFLADWSDRPWVSGGPFILNEWMIGQYIELLRNDAYWKVTQREGAPLPFLERVIVRFYEPGTEIDPRLVDGFVHGDVDVAAFAAAELRSDSFAQAISAGATLGEAPTGEWEHLNFQFGPANRNSQSANSTVEFRRAVAHAIDRQALANTRGTEVIDSILRQFVPGLGTSPFAEYDFDLGFAASFAGDGAPPVVLTVARGDSKTVAIGGEIVMMLRNAGFRAELQLENSSIFFGPTLDNGSWDLSAWRFGSGVGIGGASNFVHFFDPDGLPFVGTNYFRWGTVDSTVRNSSTERYRDLIDEIDSTVDPQRVAELLIEAEQILADQAVIIPLIGNGATGVIAWPNRVAGVAVNAVDGPLWNVEVWRAP